MIPIHPERIPDDPETLRWVIPAGTLPFVGEPATSPAGLQDLITAEVIRLVTVEPCAVRIVLCNGRSWRRDGAAVRSALQAALATPTQWRPRVAGTSDDVLRAAATEVLEGEVGDYIRSHGGLLEVVDISDGRLQVAFSGTCAHCPASDITLTHRFEDAVRERFPALVGVRVAAEPGIAGGRKLLGLFPRSARP